MSCLSSVGLTMDCIFSHTSEMTLSLKCRFIMWSILPNVAHMPFFYKNATYFTKAHFTKDKIGTCCLPRRRWFRREMIALRKLYVFESFASFILCHSCARFSVFFFIFDAKCTNYLCTVKLRIGCRTIKRRFCTRGRIIARWV